MRNFIPVSPHLLFLYTPQPQAAAEERKRDSWRKKRQESRSRLSKRRKTKDEGTRHQQNKYGRERERERERTAASGRLPSPPDPLYLYIREKHTHTHTHSAAAAARERAIKESCRAAAGLEVTMLAARGPGSPSSSASCAARLCPRLVCSTQSHAGGAAAMRPRVTRGCCSSSSTGKYTQCTVRLSAVSLAPLKS